MGNKAPREKLNFCFFQEFFASIDKIFVFGGRLSTRL